MTPGLRVLRFGRRALVITTLIVVALLAMFVYVSMPPTADQRPAAADTAPAVRGVFHVHTNRSDGTGSVDEVAAAAARAGLKFVVFTDHGDGTREPDKPMYRRGVLCIDAVEISTEGGHVIALGMSRSPYPLAGEARDVIEDIARLGGMSIAAHPSSNKPHLRWVEWGAPFDGFEWLNGDSEWRDERLSTLARMLFTFPFRKAATLSQLLDRPDAIMRRWDVLTGRRQVVALAAADAHARISLRGGDDEYDSVGVFHLPAYEDVFRTFSIAVPDVALSDDAETDARVVVDALRRGHVYSAIDAIATPAAMTFAAVRLPAVAPAKAGGPSRAGAGDVVPLGPGDVTLSLTSNAPENSKVVLWKNGQPQPEKTGSSQSWVVSGSERTVYRVEISVPDAPGEPPVPWVVSNPIYLGDPTAATVAARPPAVEFASQYENGFATDWTVATSVRSKAALDVVPAVGGTQLSMRWALGGTQSESPFAALVMPAGPALSGYDRLTFTARGSMPMRVSVQILEPIGTQGERWHRSVYIDPSAREITVFFDEMTPRGYTTQRRPVLANVRDVLFVIDTVNTKPGSAGQIWIDDVKYGR